MNIKKVILEKILGTGISYINPWGKWRIRWKKLTKQQAFDKLIKAGWKKTTEHGLTYYTNGIHKVIDKPNLNFLDTDI